MMAFLILCGLLIFFLSNLSFTVESKHLSYHLSKKSSLPIMHFTINKQWDSTPITHTTPAQIHLSWKQNDDFITADFKAQFFNDPKAPDGPAGKPFPKLWDYEVVEIFFLNSITKQYLEVEVSPHGQHILLLLNGTRNMIKDELPMHYTASIDHTNNIWTGTARIPLSYLPQNVDKMNAYAIYGSDKNRVYEALYPTEKGKFPQPDFHRLDYFKDFDIDQLVKDKSEIAKYWDTL